jgi:hypothetical protein
MQTDAVQLDFFSEDPNNSPMLLSAIGEGIKNDYGVYTENVLEFMEGKLSSTNVKVNLCAEGNFIIYEFSYQAKDYGCSHPLVHKSHYCHRKNSASFLAECIYNDFQHSVVPYDKNLVNYTKETKELLKLCRKVCDRIAAEVI